MFLPQTAVITIEEKVKGEIKIDITIDPVLNQPHEATPVESMAEFFLQAIKGNFADVEHTESREPSQAFGNVNESFDA